MLTDRLEELRRKALILEPEETERNHWLDALNRYLSDYLNRLETLPAFVPAAGSLKHSPAFTFSETGRNFGALLEDFERDVNRPGLKPGLGRYLAYIPGGGLYASALGDFLAAITNKYAGVYFAAPGAVLLERSLVRWLAETVGYPDSAEGDLTSGGSIAHLSALVAAREAAGLRVADIPRAAIYLSPQTHHSVAKALRIAGLSEAKIRRVALDDRYRISPEHLEERIRRDSQQGLRPFLIVASAGTTDSGAVDPLNSLADVAARHGVWLHVDAAYGGAFALCREGKKVLAGLERSDSLILDPHKGLFLPFGTGAVLVRKGEYLRKSFEYEASYLLDKDHLVSGDIPSPADLSPELSRHFRGLRLWLPLKLHGVAPFRAALEEKLLLARYAYGRMAELPGFELGPPPDLTLFTFRYRPRKGDPDAFNRKFIQAVQRDGRVFLSATEINGRFTLRMTILGFRTHRKEVDLALQILREKAEELEKRM